MIGANALLARVSAYYHDIGKVLQPGMYIENQLGGETPHEEMSPEDSATMARDYVGGLTASRYVGSPGSSEANTGMNTWVATFAGACFRSVADARAFESRAATLEEQWRERVGRVRANSATALLLQRLPGIPVLTAESAAMLLGWTFKPANDAIQRLVQAGILRQITIGRRSRAYEAPEIIEAFADLERQLCEPGG